MAEDLDVVSHVLEFVRGERERTKARAVSRTWKAAYQLLRAGPRILVLVEWKIVICDEMAQPISSISFTPPQIDGCRPEVEPAHALKKLVTAGDLAIIAYWQGWVQAINMVSRTEQWRTPRMAFGDASMLWSGTRGLQCIACSTYGGENGCLAIGFTIRRLLCFHI